jgi:hypothetical protein
MLVEDGAAMSEMLKVPQRFLPPLRTPLDLWGHLLFTTASIGIVGRAEEQLLDLMRAANLGVPRSTWGKSTV